MKKIGTLNRKLYSSEGCISCTLVWRKLHEQALAGEVYLHFVEFIMDLVMTANPQRRNMQVSFTLSAARIRICLVSRLPEVPLAR